MLLKENKAQSTIRNTFTKEKNSRTKGGGRGPLGGPLNPPLIQALDLLLIHLQNVN